MVNAVTKICFEKFIKNDLITKMGILIVNILVINSDLQNKLLIHLENERTEKKIVRNSHLFFSKTLTNK